MYVVKEQSGRYETVDTLSDGAMGSVVLARDRLMDRLVAIKSIKPQNAHDATERQRLQDALLSEAQVVQLLSHPHIVAIHDILDDTEDPGPALVLEYVPGSNLEEYLKGGHPLPLDFALTIGIQIAQALEHAHSMGVIHGDIKPSNILISDDGEEAKIADFGIAQLVESDREDSPLFGTPRYISPEQILGHKADQRSDLFSLGVVLYEMLTGHSPFTGQTSKEVTQEIARGAADLSDAALQEVPEPLRAVLSRALERDPAKRFQSARQIALELQGPEQVEESADAVTTQDLSSLVVPEIPDAGSDEEVLTSPDPDSIAEPDARMPRRKCPQWPVSASRQLTFQRL